jgi:hypothetical protein
VQLAAAERLRHCLLQLLPYLWADDSLLPLWVLFGTQAEPEAELPARPKGAVSPAHAILEEEQEREKQTQKKQGADSSGGFLGSVAKWLGLK